MKDNNRDSNRLGLVIDIKLIADDNQEYIHKSRNISDTGVFLEHLDDPLPLTLGTQVILQVSSMLNNDEEPPPVKAEVMRITDEGIGLRFIL